MPDPRSYADYDELWRETVDAEQAAAEADEARDRAHLATLPAGAAVTWHDAHGTRRYGTSMGATPHAAFVRVVVRDGAGSVAVLRASMLERVPEPPPLNLGDDNVRSDWEVA